MKKSMRHPYDARRCTTEKNPDKPHELALSVSHGRVIDVEQTIARAVCKCHVEDAVVSPTNLLGNVFVT